MLHWRGKMTLDIWNRLSNLCLKPFADRVSQKATPCVHRTTKFIGWLCPHGLHTTTVTVKAVWQVWSRKFKSVQWTCDHQSVPHISNLPGDGAAERAEGCWGFLSRCGKCLWCLLVAAKNPKTKHTKVRAVKDKDAYTTQACSEKTKAWTCCN